MNKFLKRLVRDERGISALEYAILAGVIIAVIVAALGLFSDDIKELFGRSGAALDGVNVQDTK